MRKGLESIDDGSEIVIFTDADDEIAPKDIQKVLNQYKKDTDIVAVFRSRFKQISLNTILKWVYTDTLQIFLTIVSNVIFNQNLRYGNCRKIIQILFNRSKFDCKWFRH